MTAATIGFLNGYMYKQAAKDEAGAAASGSVVSRLKDPGTAPSKADLAALQAGGVDAAIEKATAEKADAQDKARVGEAVAKADAAEKAEQLRIALGGAGGAALGGGGSAAYDVAKGQDVNYRRALILAALGGALGGTAGYLA